MINPIGCDIHEMYTDYPLLLNRMDFVACRTGQGVYQLDGAYARHKKAIIGKRPLLAWHVQFPWQSALAQVDAFLRIQPPEDGVRHSWDCELEWQSQNAVTDHLAEIMRLMLAKTGRYPLIYSAKWFIDPWIDARALPPETEWWLAEYAELKRNWYVNRGSGGYTIVDSRLEFALQPIAGIKPENILIHQPTSHANGRLFGAWTAADGRLDIDYWLQGGLEGMLKWFANTHNETIPIPTPEPPIVEPQKVLWRGKVLPEIGLNVRSGKNFLNNVIRLLPFNTEVSVYEVSDTWARIAPDAQEWVASRFLEKIKEGEPIPTNPGDIAVLDITPLYQRAYLQKLGTSNTTIAGYGCLSPISVTMYVNFLLGTNYTPLEVHDAIKKVGGYVNAQGGLTNANLFRFASLWEAFPEIAADKLIRCKLIPAPLPEIDKILADSRPVIVETRMSNHTQQHWVLIIGKRDGKYVCNDPWTGKQVNFEDVYGEPARWIYTIVSYKRKAG